MSQDEEGGTSLAEFAGEAFGDLGIETVPSATPSTPSATPTPSAEPTPAANLTPETTPVVPAADTPPAASTPAVVDTPPDDPLKDATPFTYTVDGQVKSYDGIRVLGDAAIVENATALADLQRKLGEWEHLKGANQTLYADVQAGKQQLAALTYTSGETQYTGPAAFNQLAADYALFGQRIEMWRGDFLGVLGVEEHIGIA